MPRTITRQQRHGYWNEWTPKDKKELRQLAGRYPIQRISKIMRRSESAVRQRGYSMGLSFALR